MQIRIGQYRKKAKTKCIYIILYNPYIYRNIWMFNTVQRFFSKSTVVICNVKHIFTLELK